MKELNEHPDVDLNLPNLGTEQVADYAIENPNILKNVDNSILNTEEILHQVVEAAEHNQAIEALLERRHEIKDEQTSTNQSGATQIGAVLGSRQQPNQSSVTASTSLAGQQQSNYKQVFSKNSLYGHAIRYGVVTGICAMLVAIMTVLLFT
jgi:hypothetical protein